MLKIWTTPFCNLVGPLKGNKNGNINKINMIRRIGKYSVPAQNIQKKIGTRIRHQCGVFENIFSLNRIRNN